MKKGTEKVPIVTQLILKNNQEKQDTTQKSKLPAYLVITFNNQLKSLNTKNLQVSRQELNPQGLLKPLNSCRKEKGFLY